MARTATKKSTARRTRRKTAARPRTAARRTTAAAAASDAPAAGSIDLAGGLRSLLTSIEAEVRAVSALSERIDDLVRELNDRRDEQAKRLGVLDTLRGSVEDTSLGAFLEKAIRPRKARITEVIPDRLNQ